MDPQQRIDVERAEASLPIYGLLWEACALVLNAQGKLLRAIGSREWADTKPTNRLLIRIALDAVSLAATALNSVRAEYWRPESPHNG